MKILIIVILSLVSLTVVPVFGATNSTSKALSSWVMGTPITTYWAGPPMSDVTASQMAQGGWNLVWCNESELDAAQRHGLRAMLYNGLLKPASLDDPKLKSELDALIERVRSQPALYAYMIKDEPDASMFPDLGRLVRYLHERDPSHLAYINLLPTYALNKQLGTRGDTATAYKEYLRQYIELVRPDLLSYDHYSFSPKADGDQYFLNLELVRQASVSAGIPFMNIVQASSWSSSYRIPSEGELRWLGYTSLAYGSQGISYFVYSTPKWNGGMANADGSTTPLYPAAKALNREFVAIASQLQSLRSLGAYHSGMQPPGTVVLPKDPEFWLDPVLLTAKFESHKPVQGFVLGYFGQVPVSGQQGKATHVIVVNLDYKHSISTTLVSRSALSLFDAVSDKWTSVGSGRIELHLPPGGGELLRTQP